MAQETANKGRTQETPTARTDVVTAEVASADGPLAGTELVIAVFLAFLWPAIIEALNHLLKLEYQQVVESFWFYGAGAADCAGLVFILRLRTRNWVSRIAPLAFFACSTLIFLGTLQVPCSVRSL